MRTRWPGSLLLWGWMCLVASAPALASSQADADALTRMLTAQVSTLSSVSVVSQAELRDALELESKRQALGCDPEDGDTCIAEIAAAMGTSHVLQAQLGRLGSSTLLTLQLFDDQAVAVGRQAVRGETLDDIAAQLGPALADLLQKGGLRPTPAKDASLLILDVKLLDAASGADPAAAPAPLSPWTWGGALVAGAGGTALATSGLMGGLLLAANEDASVSQSNLVLLRNSAVVLSAVGGVVTVVGAGVLGLGWVVEGASDVDE